MRTNERTNERMNERTNNAVDGRSRFALAGLSWTDAGYWCSRVLEYVLTGIRVLVLEFVLECAYVLFLSQRKFSPARVEARSKCVDMYVKSVPVVQQWNHSLHIRCWRFLWCHVVEDDDCAGMH